MPIYQYEGVHYDLPDGLSNEDAIAKIEAHLGKTPSSPTATPKPTASLPPMPVGGDWDLPLGLLETGTTGVAQAVGGVLAKAAGGIKGALTPGQTAAETGNNWAKNFAEATDSALSPQTVSGQRIQKGIGDFLQGAGEYAQDPQNIQNTLRAIPFMPESVATEPHLGGAASALIQSAPDLSVLTPLLGHKPVAKVPEVKPKSTGNPILDALDAAHTKEPVVAPTGEPLVDTRPSLDKSKLAYEQALREQELARQSAFNRPEQIGNLPQEDAMSRMARDLGAEPNKIETPVDTTTPMGNMADQLTKDVGNNKTMTAQDVIDARNKEHDTIAQNLEAARQDMENRKQASNMDSTPSAEAQAHMDQIAAEEQHRTHLEETHARAMDEQARLEEAQKAIEARQKAIDDSMSGVKSQHEGIRQLTAEGGPKTERLAAEAELRRRQEEAPTKSKKQIAIEAKAALEAERTRLVEQRAANEEMIQKLRDQHTESDIRTKQAQADAQEAIAKRNEANTAETTKAAQAAAKLRAEAEALAKDKAKRDKALANIAKQHALQEITHPAGSKERAAAVKAVNERFSNKPAKVTGGPVKKSESEPTQAPTADVKNETKAQEANLFGADSNGITELHGGLPLPKAMRDKLDGAMKALTDAAASIGKKAFDPNTASRDYITNSFTSAKQAEDAIGKVVAPSDVIARATAPGSTDIPLNPEATFKVPFTNRSIKYGGISESVQSGLNMAALKFKEEPVIRGVQNFLNNGLARTNYQISQIVVPLTKMLNRLSPEEMVTHDGVLQREQKMGKSFTDDQLRAAGMNDKQLAAYKMQRKAYDSAYTLQNEQLKKMGEKPLSRDDYYYSSRWSGDYHTIITKDRKDVSGKVVMDPETNKPKQDVVWFVRTTSRAENLKAIEHLKENFPELNIDKDTKPKYMGNNRNPNAPHDVAGAYRDMMGFFKDAPETTAAIKEAMESYTTAKGYSNLGQSKHFEHKAGVRGFAGDTPWLTAEESAKAGTKAQVDYLKNAIRWANLQETVANAKQVLSDPKVMEMKPNAVSLAQHIINRELGLDTNIVAPIENGIAEVFGVSRNSVLRFVGDIKGMTYLQTLGLNPMYSLATPLQFMVTGPMMHMVMSSEGGYKIGVRGALKTMAFGMTDATAGIMAHMAHEMGSDTVEGFVSKAGMTDIGKQALKYMEDSGYIKRNIFDESRSVGQHTPMDKVQAGLGWTIGKPEQIARMMSFMSFVHHLDASGAFHGDVKAMFHEAEIYSDRALSSFKSFDRPMMVDKLGALGQAGFVYQSFKFQSYHTLNAAFRMLGRGDPKPIAALMIAYGLGTGMMNVPGMQELDGLVNFGKDMISKFKPDLYTPAVRDFDLRDKLLSNLPTTKVFRQMSAKSIATNGLAGEATGLAIAPHISPQILDTEHLGNNFPGAVMYQEAKEWGSIGKMAIHPNTSSLTEAAYKNLPGAKGPMEEYLPNIKQGNTPGHQVFINPNDMNNPKTMPYARNLEDEAKRKWNAVSTNEGNLKQNWYRSGQEDMRIKNALQGNIEGLLGAYHRGDTKQMADYTMAYMKLDPESTRIDEAINNGIPRQYMSKADQQVADAKKLLVMQSIMRYRNMPK